MYVSTLKSLNEIIVKKSTRPSSALVYSGARIFSKRKEKRLLLDESFAGGNVVTLTVKKSTFHDCERY